MTRFGVSPTRNKLSTYRPAKVTAAVLVYIPQREGYYRHRLDVLKLCLESLMRTSAGEADLLVFDNGSAPEVVEYLLSLQRDGKIDILMLSGRNLGKIGALQLMFNAAPGEFIAYCDDDILFYPGWLQASWDVIEAFPQVGMVSGLPVRDAARHGVESNNAFARSKPDGLKITFERWIEDDWDLDWAESTGRNLEEHRAAFKDFQDPLWEMNGVKAFPAANHFQFVAPRKVMVRAMPEEWSGKLMGKMVEMDEAIDAQGGLRLSTAGRYVRHIGNVVSPRLAMEIAALGLDLDVTDVTRRQKPHWLLRIPRMWHLLERIYSKLFDILYQVER
ncbi:MAG: glycosyltransferase family 2 protein [Anaerolineales bacterium]|nr:glycosyltransferase family 2 protein [Anaerolineales bacterium]